MLRTLFTNFKLQKSITDKWTKLIETNGSVCEGKRVRERERELVYKWDETNERDECAA